MFFRAKVENLVRMGYLKKFLPSSVVEQGPAKAILMGSRGPATNFKIQENKLEEELGVNDDELNCMHGGMASGGEMMAIKKRYVQLTEVSSLSLANFKKLGFPPILFSEEDRQGLHFPHDVVI